MTVSQDSFVRSLLNPDARAPAGLSDPEGRQAGKRFDVYRNNVAASLTEALETAFPVVAKLVGRGNFRVLAAAFLRAHPPRSPLMMFYGADMPDFLQTFPPTSGIAYLPDVARLELALREAYHAADADPVAPDELADLPPERLMAARIRLSPALRVIRSDWPLHAIWRYNSEPGSPKPVMVAEDVAVFRPAFDPWPELLPAGAACFIETLGSGVPFAKALDRTLALVPGFDLAECLGILLRASAIIAIED